MRAGRSRVRRGGGCADHRPDGFGRLLRHLATGVGPGDFVALKATSAPVGPSPAWTPSSGCLVSSRDNDSWPKAFPLDGTAPSIQDPIDAPGKARWYKFAVLPGQRIEVKLGVMPADYDLAVFRDIGQAFASQFSPATASANDLLKLTAEYAPTVFMPRSGRYS